MYSLLTDGMVIKEGDEFLKWNSWKPIDLGSIGDSFSNNKYNPIRRKLSTLEEREEFWQESKECEE